MMHHTSLLFPKGVKTIYVPPIGWSAEAESLLSGRSDILAPSSLGVFAMYNFCVKVTYRSFKLARRVYPSQKALCEAFWLG